MTACNLVEVLYMHVQMLTRCEDRPACMLSICMCMRVYVYVQYITKNKLFDIIMLLVAVNKKNRALNACQDL